MAHHTGMNRRGFLKGLGASAAGGLFVPTLLARTVGAQAFTTVSLYARLAGSATPAIELNRFDTDAWICLGDEVELFWVTTPDVRQVDLGDGLGVFPADQGGNENGLNWGSVTLAPTSHASYQIFALDGDFEAANAAGVRVFGRERAEGPLFPIDEDEFQAQLTSNATSRTREIDVWEASLPATRFSPRLRVKGIKALRGATGPFAWDVLKVDEGGAEHRFSIAATPAFQNPFSPANSDVTIPLPGKWSFSTRESIPDRRVPFGVELVCG